MTITAIEKKKKNQKLTIDYKGKEKGNKGKGKRETYLEKVQCKLEKENRRSRVGTVARTSREEGTWSNE